MKLEFYVWKLASMSSLSEVYEPLASGIQRPCCLPSTCHSSCCQPAQQTANRRKAIDAWFLHHIMNVSEKDISLEKNPGCLDIRHFYNHPWLRTASSMHHQSWEIPALNSELMDDQEACPVHYLQTSNSTNVSTSSAMPTQMQPLSVLPVTKIAHFFLQG